MAFYKVRFQKKSGLYYPQAITMGKQITTAQVAEMLADRSTVTKADAYAVLSELGSVMSTFMAQGRSVHLDGIGSFRYCINSQKQGVEKEEEVSVAQIKSIRVRFVPEMTRNADKSVATRSMQPTAVDWFLWAKEEKKKDGSTTPSDEDEPDNSGGGTSGGGTGNNPL